MVVGENGILNRATEAIKKTNEAKDEEQRQFTMAEAAMNFENTEYEDKNGEKVTIPAGFAVSQVEGENTVEDGLVIIDSDGNEFVWIPINSEDDYKKRLGAKNWKIVVDSSGNDSAESMNNNVSLGVRGDSLSNDSDGIDILGTKFSNALYSTIPEKNLVLNAKVFYISRYEAGIENNIRETSMDWNTISTKDILFKKGKEPIRNINYFDTIRLANSWGVGYNNSGEKIWQSGLVTGTQWDSVCNFIGWEISNSDCEKWGNYWNSVSMSYSNLWHSGGDSQKWNNDKKISKAKDDIDVFPTGTFVNSDGTNTKQKNIYDFSGNVSEWTTEVSQWYSDGNIIRGGSTANSSSVNMATHRDGGYGRERHLNYLGFRIVLYLK